MIEVYKIINQIDKIDIDKFFTFAQTQEPEDTQGNYTKNASG